MQGSDRRSTTYLPTLTACNQSVSQPASQHFNVLGSKTLKSWKDRLIGEGKEGKKMLTLKLYRYQDLGFHAIFFQLIF